MPAVSAFTLIRLVAGAHLIFGYLLVASPERLSRINAIAVLGDALGLV